MHFFFFFSAAKGSTVIVRNRGTIQSHKRWASDSLNSLKIDRHYFYFPSHFPWPNFSFSFQLSLLENLFFIRRSALLSNVERWIENKCNLFDPPSPHLSKLSTVRRTANDLKLIMQWKQKIKITTMRKR